MSNLPRYRVTSQDGTPARFSESETGYWTPWYIAERRCNELRDKLEQAEARVTELEGSVKHAIGWIDGDLREIIRDVGNQICSYNDLYESADRIEYMLSEVFRKQADEAEKAGGEK